MTATERFLESLSQADKILQKNIKILLYEAENLESLAYSMRDMNSVLEISKIIEQSMDKIKTFKKFSQNNYDWSSSLIIKSIQNRFLYQRTPNKDFSDFI